MSFWNVIVAMFQNLFASAPGMFAVGGLLAVLLGWGIWELLCYFGVVGPY